MESGPTTAGSQAERPPGPAWGGAWAVGGWLTAVVAATIAGGLFQAVTGRPGPGETVADLPLWAVLVLQLPLWTGLAGTAWLASARSGTGDLGADLGLRFRWADVPLGAAVGAAVQLIALPLLVVVYEAVGVDPEDVGQAARSLADRASGAAVVALLVIALVGAPLAEELFYRGLVLRAVQRRGGPAWAVVVSSLVFGVVHLRPLELLPMVAFGVAAGVLTVRSGRLGPAIAAHVAFNGVAVVRLLTA